MLKIDKKKTNSNMYELKVMGFLSQYQYDDNHNDLDTFKQNLLNDIKSIPRASVAIAHHQYKLAYTDDTKKVLKLYHDGKKERVLALITLK